MAAGRRPIESLSIRQPLMRLERENPEEMGKRHDKEIAEKAGIAATTYSALKSSRRVRIRMSSYRKGRSGSGGQVSASRPRTRRRSRVGSR